MNNLPTKPTDFGPIINDISGQATTIRQIGGTGVARWKQLVYGAHMQGAWNTVEHVTLLAGAGVGEHVHDRTEEIYYILSGEAVVRMNGVPHLVRAGDLVITPIGARHAISNPNDEEMTFFVTEVFPGDTPAGQPEFLSLTERMTPTSGFRDSGRPVPVARVALTDRFSGPWRAFSEIRLQPGEQLGDYSQPEVAEVVFVVSGSAAITVDGETYSGDTGVCVGLPAAAVVNIRNTAEREPLTIISTEVGVTWN